MSDDFESYLPSRTSNSSELILLPAQTVFSLVYRSIAIKSCSTAVEWINLALRHSSHRHAAVAAVSRHVGVFSLSNPTLSLLCLNLYDTAYSPQVTSPEENYLTMVCTKYKVGRYSPAPIHQSHLYPFLGIAD